MIERKLFRTRLEQVLWQRHLTLEEFRKRYERVAKTELSQRQAYRWVTGELSTLPYPVAQAVLEQMFDEPVARLFGPPYGVDAPRPSRRHNGLVTQRGTARTDWEGQAIAMSADRAQDFLSRIEASNIGTETLDQLADDVRRLVGAYLQQPLPTLLGELIDTQDRAFEFLEGRQRPEQSRDLYLIAGITCWLMSVASRDLGAAHDAMKQARTGYVCADNAGHDGLRASIRGLQAAITYSSGRWEDSVYYAQLGADAAARSRGTAGVFLPSGEARALAALNRLDEARAALDRAVDARDRVQADELDTLGGLCNFTCSVQFQYAAEALTWGGAPEADHAERLALEGLQAYAVEPQGRSYRNEAIISGSLAVARVARGEIDGAAEALVPVLTLPAAQRTHTIVTSLEQVRVALNMINKPDQNAIDLACAIEAFISERLTRDR